MQPRTMTPERIVVLNDLTEAKGGASALAISSALGFRERGIPVTFLTGDAGDSSELSAAGVEVIGLGQARLTGRTASFASGLYNRAAAKMIANWIKGNDTPETVYHLHGWAQILSPSAFHALASVRSRLVLSAHDFFLACPNGSFSFLKTGEICPLVPLSLACIRSDCDRRNYAYKLWRVARQAIQRHLYDPRHSPPVLTIHEGMRPFLMRAGIPSDAITALPNPVSPFTIARIPAERNREALFVGRMEETKGPDLALAAARQAGITLRLVGDGPMLKTLASSYPEAIFMGRLPPEAIGAYATQARMLLMPSRYPEPYGLVAVEALWSGLPVIAADTAFLSSDIVRANAGLACAPRDTEDFAKAIRLLVTDNELVTVMSYNGREKLPLIGLDFEDWISRLLTIYAGKI